MRQRSKLQYVEQLSGMQLVLPCRHGIYRPVCPIERRQLMEAAALLTQTPDIPTNVHLHGQQDFLQHALCMTLQLLLLVALEPHSLKGHQVLMLKSQSEPNLVQSLLHW
jgi:hypothetical protein